MIEDGGSRATVYLSQSSARDLKVGEKLQIYVAPRDEPVSCRVQRLGDEFMPVPPAISRFYGDHEVALPVTLEVDASVPLALGAIIKVPHELPTWNQWFERSGRYTPARSVR